MHHCTTGELAKTGSRLLLSLSLLSAACAREETASDRLQPHVEAIAASGVVGVQIEVDLDGDRSWVAAGVADRDSGRALHRGDRFRIASTTKTFVAAVVLSLMDEGTLSLDDTVETWLPGVVVASGNDGATITIRHLLQHRSGLANHVDDQVAMLLAATTPEEVEAVLLRTWTDEELVALAVAHPSLSAPGEAFAYSDTGYVLLGMIVQAATGDTWQSAIANRIVAPLNLRDTYAADAGPDIEGPHMRGYGALPPSGALADVTRIDPSALGAAGAVVSTPGDVNRFFAALLGGELIGPASLAAMTAMTATLPVGEDAPGMAYGLGLAFVPLSCGGGYFTHDGDTLGYHTRNGASAGGDAQVTVAISGDGEFEAPVRALFDQVFCGEL